MRGSPKRRARRERFEAWTKSDDGFDQLLEAIGDGMSLSQFCRSRDFPYSSTHNWISADQDRAARFASATMVRADHLADEIERLVDAPIGKDCDGRTDTGAVQHRRLQVDTKRWIAAKLFPRRYDDRIEVDQRINGAITHTHQVELRKLTDDELESYVRRGLDIPADAPLTKEHLQQAISTARLDWMQAVSAFARDRGVEPQQVPRLQHDPAVKARQSDQSANGNDFSEFLTRPRT